MPDHLKYPVMPIGERIQHQHAAFNRVTRELREAMAAGAIRKTREAFDELEAIAIVCECEALRDALQPYLLEEK